MSIDAVPPAGRSSHSLAAVGGRVPLYGPDFARNPGAVYELLRRYGPAAPVELAPGVEATLITSYFTALEVLRSPETFSHDPRRWRALNEGRVAEDSPIMPMMMYRPNCLFNDGLTHERLRSAVTDSLDRVDPHALRRYVERSADALIDRFAATGTADLLSEYARILPLLVFNRMFGNPEEHGPELVSAIMGLFEGTDAEKSNADVARYMQDLARLKRSQPGQDMTSWLLAHPSQLDDMEMLQQLVLLVSAGTEPTSNLIANGLRLLLSDERFAGGVTGGSLTVADALDEVLWVDPPMSNFGVHFPVRDVDLAGVLLRAGDPVVISFAAANNDPALTGAGSRSGNRAHLAYSAGPHRCPAQNQARLTAAVAVEKLLDRLPDIALAVPADELVWRPGPFHRALIALPARFSPVPVQHHERTTRNETVGDQPWNSAPSSSTSPATTSPGRRPDSEPRARRRWWRSLAAWWRGQ